MRSTKSDYECAESLYALLRGGECLTRKEIVARNLLSNHDFGRARKVLAGTGMLQHVHKSGYTLSIHVLGGPPEAYLRGASPVEDEFDALLSVWKIEPLKSAVGTSNRKPANRYPWPETGSLYGPARDIAPNCWKARKMRTASVISDGSSQFDTVSKTEAL